MNSTLRRVITAGLGSLAMTEKAVRRLIDDLVSKGDITRGEGERLLVDLERRWAQESVHFGEQWEKGRQGIERVIASAVSVALDRLGLERKSEGGAPKRKAEGRARKGNRSAAARPSARRRTRVKPASGKDRAS
jgi:polyhydroxyalkanoate synthesis regulator phasin